jgi:hypothetical protein
MEHVEGGTVADRINGRRRSVPRAEGIRLLGQLCDGLGHAHAKKLVHRDIKPQNLLLRSSDDCLKITDFGIARAAEETTRLTRPGKVIGTDRYMAPEQLADGKITPATDVFACGVVADELLPQSRSSELREIIYRCLRPDPKERYSDARELGEALAAVDGDRAGDVMHRIKAQGRATARRSRSSRATRPMPETAATAALTRKRRSPGRVLAVLGIAGVGVAGVILGLQSGGSNEPATQKSEASATPSLSVPQSSDPADQARQLSDFLRTQSRPQSR